MGETNRALNETAVARDPIAQFAQWYDEACAVEKPLPHAAALATSTADGRPSVRMVLLKGFDGQGFVFFSNYLSRKGRELEANDRASMLFHWGTLERQVRIEGVAEKLDAARVETYFRSRPRGAQLGAWASAQSRPVSSRAELATSYARVQERFGAEEGDGEVPVPPEWGGYRVVPEAVEFWQGRPGRMHDRLVYRRDGDAWSVERLAP